MVKISPRALAWWHLACNPPDERFDRFAETAASSMEGGGGTNGLEPAAPAASRYLISFLQRLRT